MESESSIRTRVQILNPLLVGGGVRDATLELRGRMLVVAAVERYSVVTQAFDITGATYQERQLGIGAILPWWCGLAVVLYPLYLFFYALFVFHAIPAIVVTGAIGLVAAWYLMSRQLIQRTPTLHIRLNITGTVYDLVIAYTPGENPTLDDILSHMRPFETCNHQYRREKFGCFSTDCLIAFPAQFIRASSEISVCYFMISCLGIAALFYGLANDFPGIHLWLFLFQTFAWAILGLMYILRAVLAYRMKRKVPEIQVALRSALGYLRAGEYDCVEPVLRAAAEAYPEDETLIALRAQIAVIRGHYEVAECILQTQPASQVSNLEQLQTIRELLRDG